MTCQQTHYISANPLVLLCNSIFVILIKILVGIQSYDRIINSFIKFEKQQQAEPKMIEH